MKVILGKNNELENVLIIKNVDGTYRILTYSKELNKEFSINCENAENVEIKFEAIEIRTKVNERKEIKS